jgi:hypothetical protein
MKSGKGKTPGIKIRVAKDKHIRLVDGGSGKWIANVFWRPNGALSIELAQWVQRSILRNDCPVRSE